MKINGKILIIEDNEFWQSLLKEFLEEAGYYVVIESILEKAIERINFELFHFITIDMNLNEECDNAETFEGWAILKVIKQLRIRDITPTMVISGYGDDYIAYKGIKRLDSVYFMDKGNFDRNKFISIVENEINKIDLKFKNDYRS